MLIAGVLFPDCHHLGLHFSHPCHGSITRRRKLVKGGFDQQGQQDDGNTPVADDGLNLGEQPEQWLGNPPQPAVVDAQVRADRHAALDARPRRQLLEPALEVGELLDVLALLLPADGPRVAGHVGDGVLVAGQVAAVVEAVVQHPVETVHLVGEAPQGVGLVALGLADAAEVAERYHTNHQKRIVDPEAFDLVDKLATMYDEPFADSSAMPTYRVCGLARERVTVALSGDGTADPVSVSDA